MKQKFLWLLCLVTLAPSAAAPQLFDYLLTLDGRKFSGRMTYPKNPDDPMNRPMTIVFQKVSENQLRVPFKVGDDTSRTWMLTRLSDGIQLKHDHRHQDGTPDEVTNYGGVDKAPFMGTQLIFPADAETTAILPEAATNVWNLRLSADKATLVYYLERHGEARFEAAFDLSKEKL